MGNRIAREAVRAIRKDGVSGEVAKNPCSAGWRRRNETKRRL